MVNFEPIRVLGERSRGRIEFREHQLEGGQLECAGMGNRGGSRAPAVGSFEGAVTDRLESATSIVGSLESTSMGSLENARQFKFSKSTRRRVSAPEVFGERRRSCVTGSLTQWSFPPRFTRTTGLALISATIHGYRLLFFKFGVSNKSFCRGISLGPFTQ